MKVSGSYDNVIRGVSQQVEQDRRPGQHHEQVNLISDPVRGLARRRGSMLDGEVIRGTAGGYDGVDFPQRIRDHAHHKTFTFEVQGKVFDLYYRSATLEVGYTPSIAELLQVYDRENQKYIPVNYPAAAATMLDAFKLNGICSPAALGRYVALAGKSYLPTVTVTPQWNTIPDGQGQTRFAVWIRGSAYSRTFTIEYVMHDGVVIKATYKTPSSGYPGSLDTSDILTSDPDYTKKVNDRVNAYNSNVTAWITTAADGASAEGIAAGLNLATVAAFNAANYERPILWREGSTLLIRNDDTPSAGKTDSTIVEVNVTDGGDNSLCRAVGREIADVAAVCPRHFPGHVVRVRPKDGDADKVTYLKAVVQDVAGLSDFSSGNEVIWQECPGVLVQPTSVFLYGTVEYSPNPAILGNVMLFARDAAELQALRTFYSIVHDPDTPTILPSVAGDTTTDPLPDFFSRPISYLGTFQDRLVIASGSKVFMSRPGDYFNWFRQSTLTLEDDDPLEVQAYGSESDTIRASVTYDRNFIMFGESLQYVVSGRQAITPKNATINIMSAYEDAVDAFPVQSGNFVFFCRRNAGFTTVHQMQPGILSETPVAYQVSSQLDSYIRGNPVEMVAFTSPNILFVRTDADPYTLYVFSYLDSAGANERVFDSWSKWTWHPDVGALTGITADDGELLVHLIRKHNGTLFNACERFSLATEFNGVPHLDSMRKQSGWVAGTLLDGVDNADVSFVFGPSRAVRLVGVPGDRLDELDDFPAPDRAELLAGYSFPAYVTPTNPFPKDSKDNAIVNCRMTLGKLDVSLANSGGMKLSIATSGGTKVVLDSKARILGFNNNVVGQQPISTYTDSALIGKEIREVSYTITAQTWLPMTVASIEWTGQYFNNTRRM